MLTGSLSGSAFLYSQDHLPTDSAADSELGPPTSVTYQGNFSEMWPWTNLTEAVISLRFPLLSVVSG